MFGSNLLTGWLPGRWPHLNEKRPIYLLSTGVEKIIEKKNSSWIQRHHWQTISSPNGQMT